jgi:protein TonB
MAPIIKDTESFPPSISLNSESRPPQQPPTRTQAEIGGRVQPVALEIPVSLNGARTVDGSDKREPFSEVTKTVLVFGNGAVIRLTSAVAPGQLLFLTNDKTKREVVCQVVKSKTYRNISGYVELEFTEPAVGFWGVRFPTDRIGPIPVENVRTAVSGQVQSPPPAPEVAAQTNAAVHALSFAAPTPRRRSTDTPLDIAPPAVEPAKPNQVAAKSLDELLAEMVLQPQSTPAALENSDQLSAILFPQEKPPVQEERVTENVSNSLSVAPAAPTEAKPQSFPLPVVQPFSETHTDDIEIPAWLKSSAAPTAVEVETQKQDSVSSNDPTETNEAFVPTFGSALTSGFNEDSSPAASGSKIGLWVGIAAALLLVAAGGFWYSQQSGLGSRVMASGSPSVELQPESVNAENTSRPAAQPPATIAAASGASDLTAKSAKPSTSASVSATSPAQNTLSTSGANTAAFTPEVQTVPVPQKPSLGKLHLAAPVVRKPNSAEGIVAAPSLSSQDMPISSAMTTNFSGAVGQPAAPTAALPVGGNVVPAKLLSSVQPVYTPIAKSQHISGDVKIDALIDAAGRVIAMKVISGPALLQQPAMDALRQWKYRPATLNNSPVSMHLMVTLQFRLQ